MGRDFCSPAGNIQRWRYLDYWIDGWIIGTDSGSVFSWRYTDRVGSSDDLFGLYAADLDFWADPRGISGRFHSGVFSLDIACCSSKAVSLPASIRFLLR